MYSAYGAYELKAAYQRNLLIGAAVATFLCGGAGIALLITDSSPEARISLESGVVVVVVPGNTLLTPRWTGLSSPVTHHTGFMGFKTKIVVVPDRPSIVGLPEANPTATFPADADHVTFDLNSSLVSRLSTFGDGSRSITIPGSLPDSALAEIPMDKEVCVIRKIDPEYPSSALAARKEGRVTIRVCVGADGLLRPFDVEMVKRHRRTVRQVSYVVMHEEPGGYSFAENLLQVLPQWMFRPMTESGNPVDGQLDITYTFVLSGARKFTLERVPPNPFRFREFK